MTRDKNQNMSKAANDLNLAIEHAKKAFTKFSETAKKVHDEIQADLRKAEISLMTKLKRTQ